MRASRETSISICLSIFLSIYLSIHIAVSLPLFLTLHRYNSPLFRCASLSRSASMRVERRGHLSVYLSFLRFIYLSISLHISLPLSLSTGIIRRPRLLSVVAPLLALCSCEWFVLLSCVLLSCAYVCDLLIF